MGPQDDDGRAFTVDALFPGPKKPGNKRGPKETPPPNPTREPFFFTLPPPPRLGYFRGRLLFLWRRVSPAGARFSSRVVLIRVPWSRRRRWWNGRHGGLKSHCPSGRVGSNPTRRMAPHRWLAATPSAAKSGSQ